MTLPRLKVTVVETPHKNLNTEFRWKIYDLNIDDKTKNVLAFGSAATFTEAMCFAGNEAARLSIQPPPGGYLYLYERDPEIQKGGIPY